MQEHMAYPAAGLRSGHGTLPANLPPRGLARRAAAAYVGISATKFDELVGDGRMPPPKRIDSRKIWDKAALDCAFENLPEETTGASDDTWSDEDAA